MLVMGTGKRCCVYQPSDHTGDHFGRVTGSLVFLATLPQCCKGFLETGRRSEDRLEDHPAIHDERHEETQHAT